MEGFFGFLMGPIFGAICSFVICAILFVPLRYIAGLFSCDGMTFVKTVFYVIWGIVCLLIWAAAAGADFFD